MKFNSLAIWSLSLGMALTGCNSSTPSTPATETGTSTDTPPAADPSAVQPEVTALIRKVLAWTDAPLDLIPALHDGAEKKYIAMDLDHVKEVEKQIQDTKNFSQDFVDNYDKILKKLDENLKKGEYGTWLVGDLPPFRFANDHSPWCNCQDNNDWNKVEVRILSLAGDAGEAEWTWGAEAGAQPDWNSFSYRFGIKKESGKWVISSMAGFDFIEGTQKDGAE